MAFGATTVSDVFSQTSIGWYNASLAKHGNDSLTRWYPDDPLFVVGNGTSDTARSNAFVVFKSGDAKVFRNLEVQEEIKAESVKVNRPGGGISMGEFGPNK